MSTTNTPLGDEPFRLPKMPPDLLRAAAIQWIDNNFGVLSGKPNAAERLIACFMAGLDTSWDSATQAFNEHVALLASRNTASVPVGWKYSSALPVFPDDEAIEPCGYKIWVHTTSPVLPSVEAAYAWAKQLLSAAPDYPPVEQPAVRVEISEEMVERVQEAIAPIMLRRENPGQDSFAWTEEAARAALTAALGNGDRT